MAIIIRVNKKLKLMILGILLISATVGVMAFTNNTTTINNYDDCVKAGGAIAESYPTQCILNGKSFVNPNQSVNSQ